MANSTTSYVKNFLLTLDHHILELRWQDERGLERQISPSREGEEFIAAFKAAMARGNRAHREAALPTSWSRWGV